MAHNRFIEYLSKLNQGKEVTFVCEGRSSMTFEVDGFIYRFPKLKFEDYVFEAFVCDQLRNCVFFNLPVISLEDGDMGPYVKHKKLTGTTMESLRVVDDGLIEQFALALSQIHGNDCLNHQQRRTDEPPPIKELDSLGSMLEAFFSTEDANKIKECYFSAVKKKRGGEVFVHGDLHRGNLLIDERGRLCAVIDWCNSGISERERDFNYFFEEFDDCTMQKLISSYKRYSGYAVSLERIMELSLIRESHLLVFFSDDQVRREKTVARMSAIVSKMK